MQPLKTHQIPLKTAMACLFGILAATGFAPYAYWLTAWLGYFGLMMLLDEKQPWCLWGFFFCYFIVGTSWLTHSIHAYGHFNVMASWGLTILAIHLMAMIPIGLYLFCDRVGCRELTKPWMGLPLLLVLSEWLRAHLLFSGFPWLLVGLSQWHGPFSVMLPVIGPYGLGWLLMQCTGCTVGYVLHKHLPAQRWLMIIVPLLIVACFVFDRNWTHPIGRPVQVAAVKKPHILYASHPKGVQAMLAQSHELWQKSDLVVWPEGSVPKVTQPKDRWLQRLNAFIQSHQSTLLFGTFTHSNGRFYNTIIGLGNHTPYLDHKHHLVAFGEYFPLPIWLCRWLASHDVPISQLTIEQRPPQLFHMGDHIHVLPLICYELAFPNWVAKYSQQANFLVSMHDLRWFQSTQASMQHLHMAQARSLENGKPQLFISEGGAMAWIDHKGRLLHTIKQHSGTQGIHALQPRSGHTPYGHGSEWTWLWFALMSILCLISQKKDGTS